MSERDYQAAKNLWEFKNPGRSYRHEAEMTASLISCWVCGEELSADIPLSELREDAKNLGWDGRKCPDCVSEEEAW